jgi:hypothetical protein
MPGERPLMRHDEPATSQASVEDRMRDVVALWDAAPWNIRKSASFRLYNAAGRAHAAGNPAACLRWLDAAADALR